MTTREELFYIPGSLSIAWHKWLNEFHPEVTGEEIPEAEAQLLWSAFTHYRLNTTDEK